MLSRLLDGSLRHSGSDPVGNDDHIRALDLLFFEQRNPVGGVANLVLQAANQFVLSLRSHVGIAMFIVGQSRDVKLVTVAGVRHFRNQVAVGSIGEILVNRLVSMAARNDFDLICNRNHDLLGHVPYNLIHHKHHGHAKFFGEVEGFNSEIKTFLRRIWTERNDLIIAMRPPPCLHHVALGGECGQAGRRASALHVDEHTRRFGHGGVADVFHHQRKAGTGGHRKCLGTAPDCALQRDRCREFVFHLDKRSADGRHTRGKALYDFGGRSNRVSGSKSGASGQCAFTTGVVAVHEVNPGEYAARISFHLSPPAECTLVAKMAKSGQYIPHKSQPLHFSGCTTCGGW